MGKQHDIWLKAAVIGSLWGASEIVLGSFLHNLRIPFSGNMLTAIGIILMVSGHRLWPQRGLVIRAGLICAALKSLSPSPIILGPMLSIFMQATLMEAALFTGRRSHAGYILGGGLAVSWNLLYRILSTIVLYGSPLIALYQNLIDFFVSQTSWHVQGYWGPILMLWALFFLWGAAAGIAGIAISRTAEKNAHRWTIPHGIPKEVTMNTGAVKTGTVYLLRPLGVLLLIVAGLYSLVNLPFILATPILALFLLILYIYDRQLLARFGKKRGFWLAIFIMIVLSGFLMGSDYVFSRGGLIIGVEMGMRAIYVIGGFGVISKELQRPRVIAMFRGKRLAPFLSAVRIAFQTTPMLIENMPGKRAWRHPARVLSSMVGSMAYSLEYLRTNHHQHKVFLIVGKKGAGKTSLAGQITEILKNKELQVAGLLAPAFFEAGERCGYLVRNIENGKETPLCKRTTDIKENMPGNYVFDPEGIRYGEQWLSEIDHEQKDLVVIDELGPFELKGMGWDPALLTLMEQYKGPMLWVVREALTEEITNKYGVVVLARFHAGKTPSEQAAEAIIQSIRG